MDLAEPEFTGTPDDGNPSELETFIQHLTECQGNLRAYLLAALGNYNDASEVLQQTNLVLWRNARSFRAGAEFMPWAITLAKYEIMSFYRDRSRDRHVFTEEVAAMMLQAAAAEMPNLSERQVALRECLKHLPPTSQEMIKLRYENRTSIVQMAEKLKRTENAVKSALVRVRKSLEQCINRRIESNV